MSRVEYEEKFFEESWKLYMELKKSLDMNVQPDFLSDKTLQKLFFNLKSLETFCLIKWRGAIFLEKSGKAKVETLLDEIRWDHPSNTCSSITKGIN
jgi:hypothetical protein